MFTFYSSLPYFFNILSMYFTAPLLRSYEWIVGLRRDQLPFRECDGREHLLWPKANIIEQR